MRELTKSLGSTSWALSLWGAQQLFSVVQQPIPNNNHPAAQSLGALSQGAESQLQGVFRRAYEAGDRVQRSAVDLAFNMVGPEALNPNRWLALSSEVVRQSAAAARALLPSGPDGSSSQTSSSSGAASSGCSGQPCGWGPMPPPT
jgi:hypothetical protein